MRDGLVGLASLESAAFSRRTPEMHIVQKAPTSVILNASGSTGCKMLSITPFWQTGVGGGAAERHALYKLSVLISYP
jgi:hypothetical protein